ncbi:MAG: hypothetical protein K2N05_07705 [Muribaculaceae bacterium]|nr:hypothetical protein [Muribaculaceae bacterium]
MKLKNTLLIFFLLFAFTVEADVTVKLAPNSINAGQLKTTMESNLTKLLTALDKAGRNGTTPNFTGISIEEGAKEHLLIFWKEAANFICLSNAYVTNCLYDSQGYQVRKIRIKMKPVDNSYTESLIRELTVSMNKKGVITGVRPAWENNEDIEMILENSNGPVEDTRRRMEILKWVEDFRCYYNEKNLSSLEKIFSDDALIITGSVVTRRKQHGDYGSALEQSIKYVKQTKEEYIEKLRTKIFKPNNKINVTFDHITVMRHKTKDYIFGVTLHQVWKNNNYKDDGWLFLLWDFKNPDEPQIHVRTWQPEDVVSQHGKFSLDDFFIP